MELNNKEHKKMKQSHLSSNNTEIVKVEEIEDSINKFQKLITDYILIKKSNKSSLSEKVFKEENEHFKYFQKVNILFDKRIFDKNILEKDDVVNFC